MLLLRALRRRFLSLILALLGLSLVAFSVSHVIPNHPAGLLTGDRSGPGVMAQTRRELGLDRPLVEQYVTYLRALARGDLGRSIVSGRPVAADLARTMPATLALLALSLALALVAGVPLGLAAGLNEGSWRDRGLGLLEALGPSAPLFWLALMLLWLFGPSDSPAKGSGAGIFLPALVLAFAATCAIAGALRRGVQMLAGRGYVSAARADGLGLARPPGRHGAAAARPGLESGAGFLAAMLAGTLLVEAVFAWPGAGAYAARAVAAGDFPAVMGFALAAAFFGLVLHFLAALYADLSDPAMKVPSHGG